MFIIKNIRKLSDGINRLIYAWLWVLMGLEALAIFFQIVFRLANIQFLGTSELSILFFIWIIFIGSTVALKEGSHISINVFTILMPTILQNVLKCFYYIAFLVFSLVVTFKGIDVTKVANLQLSMCFRISLAWFYIAIPIAGAIMSIHSLSMLIESFKDFKENHQDRRGIKK